MNERTSPYDDIVVRVVPARRAAKVRSRSHSRDGIYEALIYTNVSAFQGQVSPPPGQPDKLANLPLASVEELVIHWDHYQEHLKLFTADSTSATQRRQLFETMSPGLMKLLSGRFPADTPVRVWWSNESAELEELPWELVVYNSPDFVAKRFCFVRGLPPRRRPPVVPVDQSLRLGVIFDPGNPPAVLLDALEDLQGIEVTYLTQPPRQALRKVVSERYELLHIVADGYVSLARDGILSVHDPYRPELPSNELSALLRSSRVTLLGLTSTTSANPNPVEDERSKKSPAYRAFAYLASAELPLPSIVAPVGSLSHTELASFWHNFYPVLANTLSVEQAMINVQNSKVPKPMALFLRQPYGQLFRRPETRARSLMTVAPTKIEAELQISQSLVARLNSLAARYGQLPDSVSNFLSKETQHQQMLEAQLAPWTQMEVAQCAATA
ncbi:MAG: hypothetical protein ACPGWR_08690 [Ardenticatenaceae bacterium]